MSTKMSRSGQVVLPTSGRRTSKRVTSEIYPEIVNGGIERAPSGDFPVERVEVPPLRKLMPGRIKFIFGLANDEIGYLIPKANGTPNCLISTVPKKIYGEINSVGPDASGQIHEALRALCRPVRP